MVIMVIMVIIMVIMVIFIVIMVIVMVIMVIIMFIMVIIMVIMVYRVIMVYKVIIVIMVILVARPLTASSSAMARKDSRCSCSTSTLKEAKNQKRRHPQLQENYTGVETASLWN